MSRFDEPTERLDEYDKDEWFMVARSLKPALTWEEFEEMWDDCQKLKAARALQ